MLSRPALPPPPSPTPPALPSLGRQLPRDAPQALAEQLAVLVRRCWTLHRADPGGRPDDRD